MIGQTFISPPFPTSLYLKDKDSWAPTGMCAMQERWEKKSWTFRGWIIRETVLCLPAAICWAEPLATGRVGWVEWSGKRHTN